MRVRAFICHVRLRWCAVWLEFRSAGRCCFRSRTRSFRSLFYSVQPLQPGVRHEVGPFSRHPFGRLQLAGCGACVVALVIRLSSVQMWEAVKASASPRVFIVIVAAFLHASCSQLRSLVKFTVPPPLPADADQQKHFFAGQACRCPAFRGFHGACQAMLQCSCAVFSCAPCFISLVIVEVARCCVSLAAVTQPCPSPQCFHACHHGFVLRFDVFCLHGWRCHGFGGLCVAGWLLCVGPPPLFRSFVGGFRVEGFARRFGWQRAPG